MIAAIAQPARRVPRCAGRHARIDRRPDRGRHHPAHRFRRRRCDRLARDRGDDRAARRDAAARRRPGADRVGAARHERREDPRAPARDPGGRRRARRARLGDHLRRAGVHGARGGRARGVRARRDRVSCSTGSASASAATSTSSTRPSNSSPPGTPTARSTLIDSCRSAVVGDRGLPEGRLRPHRMAARADHVVPARGAPRARAVVGDRDGEEAGRAGPRRARALRRDHPDGRR